MAATDGTADLMDGELIIRCVPGWGDFAGGVFAGLGFLTIIGVLVGLLWLFTR